MTFLVGDIAAGFTVVDATGPHPGHGIDVARGEFDRSVAHHSIESAGMTGTEVATPGVVGGISGLADDNCPLVLITHRGKVIADHALVPTCVIPALVVATVQSLTRERQVLFGRHDAVGC